MLRLYKNYMLNNLVNSLLFISQKAAKVQIIAKRWGEMLPTAEKYFFIGFLKFNFIDLISK